MSISPSSPIPAFAADALRTSPCRSADPPPAATAESRIPIFSRQNPRGPATGQRAVPESARPRPAPPPPRAPRPQAPGGRSQARSTGRAEPEPGARALRPAAGGDEDLELGARVRVRSGCGPRWGPDRRLLLPPSRGGRPRTGWTPAPRWPLPDRGPSILKKRGQALSLLGRR